MRKLAITLSLCLAALPAAAFAQETPPGTTPTTPEPPTAPVEGTIIMKGDWDGTPNPRLSGLPAQWLGIQTKPARLRRACFDVRCAAHTFRLVTNPVRDGLKAARFEVRDRDNPFGSDERVEVQGKNTGIQGSNRWYTWSVYLPADFRTGGANRLRGREMILTKWAINNGSPPLALAVDRDNLVLTVQEQPAPGRYVGTYSPWGTPVAGLRGRWVDLAMFVRWSSAGNGQVQLWVDGVQQQMNWPFARTEGAFAAKHGGVGSYVFTGRTLVSRGGATFVKQGIFRSTRIAGRTVVIHDGMTVRAATTVPVPPAPPPA